MLKSASEKNIDLELAKNKEEAVTDSIIAAIH